MRVFVLNQHGEPLMPCSPRKARVLLRDGKAKVVKREPFTIQLRYGSAGHKQDITVGVDTGSNAVGVSVISENKELNSYEFKLRDDISKKMTQRRQYRRNRRSRLRYRKLRFNNRGSSKHKGRLSPSVKWKVNAHKRIIDMVCSLLPKHKLVLETGAFDIQKLKNPNIKNEQYQGGVQYGFSNVREYVLHRDGHKCQAGRKGCSNKLHVHHIKFRSHGGSDRPNNLITLCEKHHYQLHEGNLELNVKPKQGYKHATIMSIVRKRLLAHYTSAIETFGYVTKENRFELGIEKSHTNDAFVIAGGTNQTRGVIQKWSFKRSNNRSLQKSRKGFGISVRRQRYLYQPKDIVEWEGGRHGVNGTHHKGKRCIIWINGKKKSKKVEDLKLIYKKKNIFKQEIA